MFGRVYTAAGVRRRLPVAVRLVGAVALAGALAAGVLVLGRLAGSTQVAMLLTTAWFGVVFVAAALLSWWRRELLVPLGAGFTVVAVGAAVLLGLPMLTNSSVDEDVVSAPRGSESGAVTVRSGRFFPQAHAGDGTARLIRLEDGSHVVTLKGFRTDNGPDLRVYLSPDPKGEDETEAVDLGALKGNSGDQQYGIPEEVNVEEVQSVMIWCRAFSVGFTAATLE